MIDSLLGVELPLPVKLIVAFVIVLVLIALAAWVFRRIGGDRAGPSATRGRQPRLAVIDAASVDGRRRLVLVRRDNVEHLVMIGGPTDIVIEQNIVRAVPVGPPREVPTHRPPEQTMRTGGEPMVRPAPEQYRSPPPQEPPPRQRLEPAPRPPRAEPPRAPQPDLPRSLRPQGTRRPEPETTQVELHAAPPTADANLADMANKLEAALRRPPPKRGEPADQDRSAERTERTPPAPSPAAPATESAAPSSSSVPQQSASAAEAKPAANAPGGKSVYDSLEEEMASLLGRPPGKQ